MKGSLLLVLLVCISRYSVTGQMECGQDEYACVDGNQCIPKEAFCDLTNDCNDQSDEILFDPSFHVPSDGSSCRSWLDLRFTCLLPAVNGYHPDDFCNKDSDCREGYFKCADGSQCITKTLYCDGVDACDDGSDEIPYDEEEEGMMCRGWLDLNRVCSLPAGTKRPRSICNTESTCAPYHFMCNSGDQCIHARDFCSGLDDCKDKSDEVNYVHAKHKRKGLPCRSCLLNKKFKQSYLEICLIDCGEDSFMCTDGTQCIDKTRFCDGTPDCADGSDEMSYDASDGMATKCQSWKTLGKYCVLPTKHVRNQEDMICNTESECQENYYQCNDGNCIEGSKFCDGMPDCSDGEDETIYNGTTYQLEDGYPCSKVSYANVCVLGMKNKKQRNAFCDAVFCDPVAQMSCFNGIECIPLEIICNGIRDCSDGSDEIPFMEGEDGVKCRSWPELKKTCLIPALSLNGATNSADLLCRPEGDSTCGDLRFKCLDGSRCLDWQQFCDGEYDCDDGSDEATDSSSDGITCRSKLFDEVCHLPVGYDPVLFCFDADRDCDESSFLCADRTQCFPKKAFCNGIPDCRDGSDEVVYDRTIHNKKMGVKCRGWVQLDRFCLLPAPQIKASVCNTKSECLPLDFKCSDGKTCIFRLDFCSGRPFCKDGSDEIMFDPSKQGPADGIPCGNPFSGMTCLLPAKWKQDPEDLCAFPGCLPEQFRCGDGQCIQKDWFCDDSVQCSDGSDEIEYDDDIYTIEDGLGCNGYNPSPKYCLLPPGQDPEALCIPEEE